MRQLDFQSAHAKGLPYSDNAPDIILSISEKETMYN